MDFHKTALFRSYGIIAYQDNLGHYCCDPSLVFSTTGASKVVRKANGKLSATWTTSQCKAARLLFSFRDSVSVFLLAIFSILLHYILRQLGLDWMCKAVHAYMYSLSTFTLCEIQPGLLHSHLATWYYIRQCVHPIHTNDMLIRTLGYIIVSSLNQGFLLFCTFITEAVSRMDL